MAPQALLLARHDLRRDVLVLASEDEQQAQPAEPFGCPREIEVGRHLAGPQDQAIDARGAPRRPAARRRRPLRVSEQMQSHAGALDAREHLGVERVQVAYVVVDVAQPVFARHPGGADLALTRRYRHVLQVEASERKVGATWMTREDR